MSPAKRGPSLHLTWDELACKDGTPYPDEFIRDGRVRILARAFELIRQKCGNKPIKINSAYRTGSWNRKIGGARDSLHLYGCALDLVPPKGMSVDQFYDLIHAFHQELDVYGLGKYPTFVHIDIRRTYQNKLVTWKANGIKDSTT